MNKIKTFLVIFTVITFSTNIFAQNNDCFKFFLSDEGTTLEYTIYDASDKPLSLRKQTVKDKRQSGDTAIIDYNIETEYYELDTITSYDFSIKCIDSKILIDMNSFINSDDLTRSFGENATAEVEGDFLEFPKNPAVGQNLEDGQITIKIKQEGMPEISVVTKMYNRKVESKENITTPAGNFETYKITSDIESKAGFVKNKASSADWYSQNYGSVKSENYDKKGNLKSYQILTKISE